MKRKKVSTTVYLEHEQVLALQLRSEGKMPARAA